MYQIYSHTQLQKVHLDLCKGFIPECVSFKTKLLFLQFDCAFIVINYIYV